MHVRARCYPGWTLRSHLRDHIYCLPGHQYHSLHRAYLCVLPALRHAHIVMRLRTPGTVSDQAQTTARVQGPVQKIYRRAIPGLVRSTYHRGGHAHFFVRLAGFDIVDIIHYTRLWRCVIYLKHRIMQDL